MRYECMIQTRLGQRQAIVDGHLSAEPTRSH